MANYQSLCIYIRILAVFSYEHFQFFTPIQTSGSNWDLSFDAWKLGELNLANMENGVDKSGYILVAELELEKRWRDNSMLTIEMIGLSLSSVDWQYQGISSLLMSDLRGVFFLLCR